MSSTSAAAQAAKLVAVRKELQILNSAWDTFYSLKEKDIGKYAELVQSIERAAHELVCVAPNQRPGSPPSMTDALGEDTQHLDLCVRITKLLLGAEALPRATKALQTAARRLTAAAHLPDHSIYHSLVWVAAGSVRLLAFAGGVLRRIGVDVSLGRLSPLSPIPGGRPADGTVSDAAVALLRQLTAPELAAALSDALSCMSRRLTAAPGAGSGRPTVTPGTEATAASLQMPVVDGFKRTLAPSGLIARCLDVCYEMIGCTHYACTSPNAPLGYFYTTAGSLVDPTVASPSSAQPAATTTATAAPSVIPPSALAAMHRLVSSFESSALLDAVAGTALAFPLHPGCGCVPVNDPSIMLVEQVYRDIKQVVCCAATSVSFLAANAQLVSNIITERVCGGDQKMDIATAAAAPATAPLAAIVRATGRLLAAPRVQRLQRCLLERWMMDQRAAVAVAAATGRPPPLDTNANDDDATTTAAGRRAARAAPFQSCGWPLLDSVSVFRLIRKNLGKGATRRLDAEKDDSALVAATLTLAEPLVSCLKLFEALDWQVDGAGADAAAAPPAPLASFPDTIGVVCEAMEAACQLLRAGGRLGFRHWSLRLVEVVAPGMRTPWYNGSGIAKEQLLAAVPAAVAALWWGLGAVVVETRRPGDPNALSAGGASSSQFSKWESISLSCLLGLRSLVQDKRTGVGALGPAGVADLTARLDRCGWVRTADSLLRLHACRGPGDDADQTVAMLVELLPTFLDLPRLPSAGSDAGGIGRGGEAAGGGSGGGGGDCGDGGGGENPEGPADLLLTLAKISGRAAVRTESSTAANVAILANAAAANIASLPASAMAAVSVLTGSAQDVVRLVEAQKALRGPLSMIQHLTALMPRVLRGLRTSPAAVESHGAGDAAASGAGADAGASSGARGGDLAAALVYFARCHIRAATALAESWMPLLELSCVLLRIFAPSAGAGAGFMPPTLSDISTTVQLATSLMPGAARAAGAAVAAAASALELGISQGWLAARRDLAPLRPEALLQSGIGLLQLMEGGDLEVAEWGGIRDQAAPALAHAAVAVAAHPSMGADMAAWLAPGALLGEGEGQGPDGGARAQPPGRLWEPVRGLQQLLVERGASELAEALSSLLEAAEAEVDGGGGDAGSPFSVAAQQLWAARLKRLQETGLGRGASGGSGGAAASFPAARVCGRIGCDRFEGEREGAVKLQRCGGCLAVRYCSAECQRADWAGGHKALCKRGG